MDKVIETLEELTQKLESESAAMRAALEQAHDLYECAYYEGVYTHMGYEERKQKWHDEAQEILANMKQALSSSAGKDLLEKVQRLEAESAAMRAALGEALKTPNEWWCPTCKRAVDGKEVTYEEYHESCGTFLGDVNSAGWITKVQAALSPDAGKDLLERVQRLEAEAAAMREALGKIAHPIPWLQKAENKGYVLNGRAAVYLAQDANWLKDTAKQALNALEGGSD